MSFYVRYKRGNMKKWKDSFMLFTTKARAIHYANVYIKNKNDKKFRYRICKH